MRICLVILAVVFFVPATRVVAGPPTYTITDLGNLGESSDAKGINNYGQVVGWGYTSGITEDAFLYSGGSLTDLGAGCAYGINDLGQVVGGNSANQAFLYSSGSMQVISPPGEQGVARAINNNGAIVGQEWNIAAGNYAFIYSGGTMTDIAGGGSQAYCINSNGQVAGVNGNNQRGFLYSGGSLHQLGTLDGQGAWSNAYGINDNGLVVGDASYWSASVGHAYLSSGGTMQNLGTFGGSYSQAEAINDSGQIVGWADYSGNNTSGPFLFTGGGMYDLNSLIPSNSGWRLIDATGINDLGQICRGGVNPSGNTDAFVLTPTPEPSTLVLLVVAAIGFLACKYRWLATARGKAR